MTTPPVPTPPTAQDRLEALRARHRWLDHLVRASVRYAEKHGNHYAAAITYFSVLTLVPVLMMAFAVAGYVLAGDPHLLAQLEGVMTSSVPPVLADTVSSIVDSAIGQRDTVGVLGLVLALLSGLWWTGNLREALSEQWDQRRPAVPLLRRYLADVLAMMGLALAVVLSLAITAVGTGMSGMVVHLLGLGRARLTEFVVLLVGVVLTFLAEWVVLVWIVARLPREPVELRGAVRAAALGALGLVVLQQVMSVYLARVTTSPAGIAFGPILGLLVFINVVARLILFVTAWSATLRDDRTDEPDDLPSVIVRPTITIGRRPSARTLSTTFGIGALLGALVAALVRRE
jgi:membrane protein